MFALALHPGSHIPDCPTAKNDNLKRGGRLFFQPHGHMEKPSRPVFVLPVSETISMTASDIMEELKSLGSESIKKVLRNHGVCEPFFGVKIEDMKKIQKKHQNGLPTGPRPLRHRQSRTRCTWRA